MACIQIVFIEIYTCINWNNEINASSLKYSKGCEQQSCCELLSSLCNKLKNQLFMVRVLSNGYYDNSVLYLILFDMLQWIIVPRHYVRGDLALKVFPALISPLTHLYLLLLFFIFNLSFTGISCHNVDKRFGWCYIRLAVCASLTHWTNWNNCHCRVHFVIGLIENHLFRFCSVSLKANNTPHRIV